MFVFAWLITFLSLLVWRFGSRAVKFINNWIRIRKLVNQFVGPPTIPIFGNTFNLKWNTVDFTFQMEYFFRKYAYNECGIVRFWVGPVPIIFLSRPRSVKVVLESNTLIDKPPEYLLLKPIWGEGLITSSGEKWYVRRRMLTPAFHFKILNSYLNIFNAQAKILQNILDECYERDEIIDFLPILRRFSMDTISEAAMGVSINAQKGENQSFYLAITRMFELLFKNLRYPWLWAKPIWYALGYGFEYDRHVDVVLSVVKKVIQERKQEFESLESEPSFEELSTGSGKKLAFLDLLLSMRKEHRLSDENIMEEVGTFMVAGYDTVSVSIGYVLWLLGHRPHIQEKVYEELYSIFGDSDREITNDDLKKMNYLEQCMKESIRLYPTVVMLGRRVNEDTEICGYTIPAGVTVVVSPFAVARDPEEWDNPEIFDPENFSPEKISKRDSYAFVPFSAGPRNCIGQKFAKMEEKVALTTILRRYKVISMMTEEENRAVPEVSLKPSRGFPIRLIRR